MVLAGCASKADVKNAQELIPIFHQWLDAANYDAIVAATDVEYRKSSQQEDLAAPFRKAHERLGTTVNSQWLDTSVVTLIGGARVTVHHQTKFEKGDMRETFTFMIRDHKTYLLKYEVTPL